MALLETRNLCFQIGQGKILDELSLAISAAEIYVLPGTDSGKSMLGYPDTGL
jgi:Fe-S cluster assembly ATPase SufC